MNGRLPIIGVVLAGGRSSRMGCDKASLPWRGSTLLLHAKSQLIAAGASVVYLSGSFREDWEGALLPDMYPSGGPAAALASILLGIHDTFVKSSPSPVLLVVPVDMPLLTGDTLQEIIQALGDADCAHYENAPLPLAIRLNKNVQQYASRLVSEEEGAVSFSMKRLLEPLQSHILAVGDQAKIALRNINTPEEWEKLNHESAS
jgi:molybdopterin-guanine dinucleotide biosynthesis protein A